MIAPVAMPTFAPEPRLGPRPSGLLVDEGGCVLQLAVSIAAAEFNGEDTETNKVKVEVDGTELHRIDDSKELVTLFNWSSGAA